MVDLHINQNKLVSFLLIFAGTIFFLFFINTLVEASCTCTCVNGQQQALCTNTMDLPPLCPPRICPLVSPSVQPLQQPKLPPLGTSYCSNQQVLNPYTGMYEWRQVCQ